MRMSSFEGGLRRRRGRLGRLRLAVVATVLAATAVLGGAAPAMAGIQQEFTVFSDCPVEAPGVLTCIVSKTTSGEFVIGSKTVPINKTVTLQGGIAGSTLVPALDGNTLSKTPLVLPGGLAGTELFPPLTEVTATAELAGTVKLNLNAFGAAEGTAVTLPFRVKLSNPVLGNECYIGSNSEPVVASLTTGTTSPPPPNSPISGKVGKVEPSKIVRIVGDSLVDNALAAPGVNGCGGLLSLLVDPLVNAVAGLPAAAGHNTAILTGTTEVTAARLVNAEKALPGIGRCVKAIPVKEGGKKVFHGHYNVDCIEESEARLGEFEWVPGPGPKNKFTATSGASTLETVGHAKITCSSSAATGEYTGAKSSTATVTFAGCKTGKPAEPCQSAGAGSGQIVTSQLGGTLGFIKDENVEGTPITIVGWDFAHQPTLLTAECGTAKTSVAVSGSVIGPVSIIDKMSLGNSIKFKAVGGVQAPQNFDTLPNDTLSLSLGGGSPEEGGLTSSQKVTNEEKLEIKAEAE